MGKQYPRIYDAGGRDVSGAAYCGPLLVVIYAVGWVREKTTGNATPPREGRNQRILPDGTQERQASDPAVCARGFGQGDFCLYGARLFAVHPLESTSCNASNGGLPLPSGKRTQSMPASPRAQAPYPLGYSDGEAERLGRQAARHNAVTERVFREGGVGSGQRVLEVGSGLGHVSRLIAGIVGESGEVVGIERDAQSIAKAEQNVRAAGLRNVRFMHGDVHELAMHDKFDALVGRFILMFLPDPAAALRSLATHVRAGGIVVFHEISWTPFLALAERLPLSFALARICHEAMCRSHADMDMGLALHRTFIDAGLEAPVMRLEMMLGVDDALTQWVYDIFQTVQPKIAELGIDMNALGDLRSLYGRLRDETLASNAVISSAGLVGAWTQKP